jgi:DNA-binding transcriptional LysR family regulator
MVPSLALDMVPRAITRFRRERRNVSFEVHTKHHDELVRSLQERECDIAIAYDPPPHPRLAMTKLVEGELVVLSGSDRFGAGTDRLPLTALDGCDLIGVTASGPLGDMFAAAARAAEIDYQESISVQTFFIAAAIAQLENGVTVVDEFTARHWASRGLSYRFIDPPLRFSLQCVFLEERPLPKLAQRFVETLRATIAEERDAAAIEADGAAA